MGLEFQDQTHVPKPIKDLSDNLTPAELASLVKAYDVMEDRKRVLRMKGLPKAVEVKDTASKGPRRAVFTE